MQSTTSQSTPAGQSPVLAPAHGSAMSPDVRLAALIAREIAARFYLCTDKGIGGECGYSANFYDDEQAVEMLVEMILPLLPNVAVSQPGQPLWNTNSPSANP
jgi:hypothetical protein